MNRKIKVLIGAIMAMTAMSALVATAHAETEFVAPNEATTLTTTPDGTGKTAHQVFDAGTANGAITCAGVSATASTTGTKPSITTTALSYTGPCTFLGQSATVVTNGCQYTFHGSGLIDVGCSGTNKIEFTAAGCTVQVGPQTSLSSAHYHNLTETNEVTISINETEGAVGGITWTASGTGCKETGTHTTGTYTTGNVIITGEKAGTTTMVPISVN